MGEEIKRITESGVPETPRQTSKNEEHYILKNEKQKDHSEGDNYNPQLPDDQNNGSSNEDPEKKPFYKFSKYKDSTLGYMIDKRLFNNGYQLSSFMTIKKFKDFISDKNLYVLRMGNNVIAPKEEVLFNNKEWKEIFEFLGLDIEKSLNEGRFAFVTEKVYEKKVKELMDLRRLRDNVNTKVNYKTYEDKNRRRL